MYVLAIGSCPSALSRLQACITAARGHLVVRDELVLPSGNEEEGEADFRDLSRSDAGGPAPRKRRQRY